MWTHLALFALLFSIQVCLARHSQDYAIECSLDDDNSNQQLDQCWEKAENFLTQYNKDFRHLNRKPNIRRYRICREYKKYQECVRPILDRCPAIERQHREEWSHIEKVFGCACDVRNVTTKCLGQVECFEDEMGGVLGKQCDAMYKFNLEQGTRDKCFFLKENINCKTALVSSACSEFVGDMTFQFLKLAHKKQLLRARSSSACSVIKRESYKGFQYTESCETKDLRKLAECETIYLSHETKLYFHDRNNLIVDGSQRDIQLSCRDFKKYKNCIRSIKESCPKMLKMIYGVDERLRIYNLKLNYICSNSHKEYGRNLQCYKTVLERESLSTCNPIWGDIKPQLERVSPAMYYCFPNSTDSSQLHRDVERLRLCFEDVFSRQCGDPASRGMSGLMQKAFHDPSYLRYRYKPQCHLHKIPKMSTTTTTTTSTTSITTVTSSVSSPSLTVTDPELVYNGNQEVKDTASLPTTNGTMICHCRVFHTMILVIFVLYHTWH